MELWLSPLILWLAFAVTMPAMAISRYRGAACFMSGVVFASAIFTTVVVAGARF